MDKFPIQAASSLPKFVLDSRKGLLQIGENVVDVLGADGQADGVGLDALICQLLLGALGVGGGGRVDHKALHIGHIGKQGEDLQIVNELPSRFLTALDLKGEDGGTAVGEVLLIQGVIRMIGQAGVIDLGHLGMLLTRNSTTFLAFSA